MNFNSFPFEEINRLAASHGVKEYLHFHFDEPDLRGYPWIAWLGRIAISLGLGPKGAYNHHTKFIFLAPKLFKPTGRLSFYTAHEVGHAVTLRNWPMWIHDLSYWPVILTVPTIISVITTWWWFIPVMMVTYLLHPFEIMANSYAHRYKKEYETIFKQSNLG